MNNSTLSKSQHYIYLILNQQVLWIQYISHVTNTIVLMCMDIIITIQQHSCEYLYLIYCNETRVHCHLNPLSSYLNYYYNHNAHTEPIKNICPTAITYILVLAVYNIIGMMMYKYDNDMLPSAKNELFIVNSGIHEHNARQRHVVRLIGEILIFPTYL